MNPRILKFRGWTGVEMREAFDLSQNPKYWWEDNKDCQLMQYTELQDADGTPIYDGDILVRRHDQDVKQFVFTVRWGRGLWVLKCDGLTHSLAAELKLLDGTAAALIVIGNIHENPELVEVEK